jgi:hypothetical protein
VNEIPDEPFGYEWFARYRSLWFDHPHQQDIEIHMLCRRLQALLAGAEPQDYNLLFDRLWNQLEEIRNELKIGAARNVFEKTALSVGYGRDIKTKEVTYVVRKFPNADEEIVKPVKGEDTLLDLRSWSAGGAWLKKEAAKARAEGISPEDDLHAMGWRESGQNLPKKETR